MERRNGVGRVVVIIPTYNERENVEIITRRLLDALPDVHALIVDDASPDGTGELAEHLAAQDGRLHVLRREAKQGLGAAYVSGFQWALARDYDVIVEMDADGSHQPEELCRLLDAVAGGCELVLGSRWVPGGRVVNWPLQRKILSRGGTLYAQVMLGIPLRDATGGYRAFRATALEKIDLAGVQSQGYCFQIDMAVRAVRAGFAVREVPITFVERVRGNSKMSSAIVREALWRVTQWGISHRLRRLTALRSERVGGRMR